MNFPVSNRMIINERTGSMERVDNVCFEIKNINDCYFTVAFTFFLFLNMLELIP